MTKLDKARNVLEQHTALTTIINEFYWEGSIAHTMYFTEEESSILAEYLINNGIVISKERENER